MTIGSYCQVCGEKKKALEIIAEAQGVVATAECLLAKIYGDPPATAAQAEAMVRFCRQCGAEQPRPLPDRCGKCGAVILARNMAADLNQAGQPARLLPRALAFLADLAVIVGLSLLGVKGLRALETMMTSPGHTPVEFWQLMLISFLTVFLAYHTLFAALIGWTPAKLALGLRVVRKDGATDVGFYRAFLRSGLYLLTLYVFAIGFLLLAFQEPREKWPAIIEQDSLFHNPLTDTVVIKT